jgi:hypothetical protein
LDFFLTFFFINAELLGDRSIVLVVGLAYFSSFSSSVIPGDLQTENFDHLATF